MKWSAIKHTFESLLAESLKGRIHVHLTEYTRADIDIGRGWISLDGAELISVQIPSIYDTERRFEVTDLNFGRALGEYIQMPFEKIKASKDPIIQGLSFLDKRYGKRSLKQVDVSALHDFSVVIYMMRCRIEGDVQKLV